MNINENLKMRENIWQTSIQRGNQTYIEHIGHYIMGVNLFNGTTYNSKKRYCPQDHFHIGPLDERTSQIVSLMI